MKIGILAESVPQAEAVGRALGLRRAEIVPVTNRSSGAVRGTTLDGLIICPDVEPSEQTAASLWPACNPPGPGPRTSILDLRRQK